LTATTTNDPNSDEIGTPPSPPPLLTVGHIIGICLVAVVFVAMIILYYRKWMAKQAELSKFESTNTLTGDMTVYGDPWLYGSQTRLGLYGPPMGSLTRLDGIYGPRVPSNTEIFSQNEASPGIQNTQFRVNFGGENNPANKPYIPGILGNTAISHGHTLTAIRSVHQPTLSPSTAGGLALQQYAGYTVTTAGKSDQNSTVVSSGENTVNNPAILASGTARGLMTRQTIQSFVRQTNDHNQPNGVANGIVSNPMMQPDNSPVVNKSPDSDFYPIDLL
jgi:hypothetical protein